MCRAAVAPFLYSSADAPLMTRARKFLHGVSSGYLVLGLNALYTLASVPLVLSYLSQDQFGVWIVVGQLAGYLTMVDLGTNTAGMRLLIDYKDDANSGVYGGLIKTMVLTQWLQALVILVLGVAVTGFLSRVLRIDPALAADVESLWIWQVIFLVISFSCKVGSQLLAAHQRMDICNYAQAGSIILNFVLLWIGLASGFKLYSFVIAQGAATLLTAVWTVAAAFRMKLTPLAGGWGKVSLSLFRKLFGFGAEIFLIALGTQFITSSQSLLVTRLLGLDAASFWAVMTKTFTLVCQLCWRIIGPAQPALSEMLVRNEVERLWKRYRELFQLVLLLSTYFGILIAVSNTPFVHLWTRGKIDWPRVNDALVGFWLVLLTIVCCHSSLVMNTKAVRFLKYIYFVEGVVFILSSLVVIPRAGFTGMLLCSIASTLLFTVSYGVWRIALLAGVSPWTVGLGWMKPVGQLAIVMVPVAAILAFLSRSQTDLFKLVTCALPVAIIGAVALLRLLPQKVIETLAQFRARLLTFKRSAEH
jgi:O-antigen/teichoic acid export membrane protein